MAPIRSSPLLPARIRKIEYPTGDGRPMAETDRHRNEMVRQIDTLSIRYATQKVYVTGNLLLFYREGDKYKHVSPDLMVVKGAEPGQRDNYLLWEEGIAPQFVLEITSKSTKNEDVIKKQSLYQNEIGVNEYFLFDPTGDYLNPCLQGYRLADGRYQSIEPVESRLESKELGLFLEFDGKHLRFFDPSARSYLPAKDDIIAEKDVVIAEKDVVIAEKDDVIAEKDEVIAEKDEVIAEKDDVIAEKDEVIAEKVVMIAEKDEVIADSRKVLAEKDDFIRRLILELDQFKTRS